MNNRASFLLVATASVATLLFSTNSYAGREGKWQITLSPRYIADTSVDFKGGASADLEDTVGAGFGVGYNFSEHLELNVDFSWSSMNYTAIGQSADNPGEERGLTGRLETSSTQFNLTYNFLAKDLTPFVAAGFGWSWVDSNIAAGEPVEGCWYDPWWGYYCSDYQPTYSDTALSYNAAIGARWDIKDAFFMRAALGEFFMDANNAKDTPAVEFVRVDFGFAF